MLDAGIPLPHRTPNRPLKRKINADEKLLDALANGELPDLIIDQTERRSEN